ncbi:hypothetical protein J0895_23025 [Phormidium pseudopriestleyi FRX01]|uniref:Uncharacterized protein n=1 Tax=Phormidium pseudopriestleyi FRX01 TaxID=1759528 RepID=A0ABS3FYI4_9CYAN|nr:hypothetical protein [Phormidium pseudopriestleyi]MBO0351902.1 hypothetical protein [Phormidium pseudopriestleyi FRX01]
MDIVYDQMAFLGRSLGGDWGNWGDGGDWGGDRILDGLQNSLKPPSESFAICLFY